MSNVLTTYSAKDLNLSLTSPVFAPIMVAGVAELGLNELSIRMTTDQSIIKVGADGSVVPSVVPGDMGEIEIQVWQTSTLHQLFLAAYNLLKAARDTGDVSNWFGATLIAQNIVDGTSHHCTGVGFKKVPDKRYSAEAQIVTWTLVACDISSL